MSPVEICGMPKRATRNLAWVPLPEPGGPKRMTALPANGPGPEDFAATDEVLASTKCLPQPAASDRAPAPSDTTGARGEAFVMTHDELGFDLVDSVHGYAHYDQQ